MQGMSGNRTLAPGGITLVGAALIIVGVLLPWVTISFGGLSENVSGLDTDDGKIALGIGAVVALFGLIMLVKPTRGVLLGAGIVALILGVAQAIFSVIDLSDISDAAGGVEGLEASAGIGLYLTLGGAVVALVGGLMGILAARRMPRGAPAPPAPGFGSSQPQTWTPPAPAQPVQPTPPAPPPYTPPPPPPPNPIPPAPPPPGP
jgi:hypothetical protein